jgi:hypothetical protein
LGSTFETNSKNFVPLTNFYLIDGDFYSQSSNFIFKYRYSYSFTNQEIIISNITKFVFNDNETLSYSNNIYFDETKRFIYVLPDILPAKIYKIFMSNLTLERAMVYNENDNIKYCVMDSIKEILICVKTVPIDSKIIIIDINTLNITNSVSIDCFNPSSLPLIDKSRNSLYVSCININDQPILVKYQLDTFIKTNSIEVLSKNALNVKNMKMDSYYLYLIGESSQYILRVNLDSFTAIDYINHDRPASIIGSFEISDDTFAFIAKFGARGSLVFSTLDCPKGTYSTDLKYPCTPCIAGTYSTVIGSNSNLNCINCPTGYYSTVHLI